VRMRSPLSIVGAMTSRPAWAVGGLLEVGVALLER